MSKVHFFKLAQELGERPVELQKRLNAGGIAVRSTSTMLDEETEVQIREFLRKEAAEAQAQAASQLTPEPTTVTIEPVVVPVPAATSTPTIAPVADVTPPVEPASEEQRPVTRVIKRIPGTDGHPATRQAMPPKSAEERAAAAGQAPQRADGQPPKVKKRSNLLITPETEGGLSADADFGIVKAAGIVPMPQPPPARPDRQPRYQEGSDQRPARRADGTEQRPLRPGEQRPRPAGERPRAGAPAPQTPPPELGATGKAAAGKAAPRSADAKKKQKRTVFSEQDKERARQQRSADFSSTTIRTRRKRRSTGGERNEVDQPLVLDEPVIITGAITVGELAERVQALPAQVITQLISMGVMATVNQQIEPEQAISVLEKLGYEALYEREMVEQASWRLTSGGTEAVAGGELRPPVVTILGHVDHGKTTLLDSIRKTNVIGQEFGGITQHIGAYQTIVQGKKITFLDTPGHAAFTAMRARGANLTDIAVLVVASDDGIQPQTIEAIDHAKAAKVPIIVAINKIDLPDAQPEVVKQQLTSYGLVSEEWGGDTIMVPLSAKRGLNIEQLLEMILLQAEMQDLHAQADIPAHGAVVESKLDKQRGPVATVLVQQGTLHIGDALVIGMVSGKIRAMSDDKGRPLREAGPSTPVEITGLSEVPVAGDLFDVMDDERKARDLAEQRQLKARDERLQTHMSLQNLSNMVASGQVRDLNIIVKSDVAGSIEAISQALSQNVHAEIRVNIIHAGVGDITESDVLLASASDGIIVGFHVRTEPQARLIAEEAGIDVRSYQVIYDLVDDVQKAMVGMLKPIFEEAILGHAEVRAVFKITRFGKIAGCYVTDGLVRRNSKARVKRDGELVHEGAVDTLKHLKDDVREMAQGFECGISLDSFSDWKEGDVIESYIIKELRRETL